MKRGLPDGVRVSIDDFENWRSPSMPSECSMSQNPVDVSVGGFVRIGCDDCGALLPGHHDTPEDADQAAIASGWSVQTVGSLHVVLCVGCIAKGPVN